MLSWLMMLMSVLSSTAATVVQQLYITVQLRLQHTHTHCIDVPMSRSLIFLYAVWQQPRRLRSFCLMS